MGRLRHGDFPEDSCEGLFLPPPQVLSVSSFKDFFFVGGRYLPFQSNSADVLSEKNNGC